jgi:bacillithiol system protein YtxJ
MNLLTKLFGDQHKDTHLSAVRWLPLTERKQLDDIVGSGQKPVAIFKHSTRCGISNMILRKFESGYSLEGVDTYYLDILRFRDLSNEIADRFGVVHQSPQVLLVMAGKCVYCASHSDVDAAELKIKIAEHQ